MDQKTYEWLPHLENSIPAAAHGDRICTFAIALEGWRRGLALTFFRASEGTRIYYSLRDKDSEHRFIVTRGDKVTAEAVKICINKGLTKKHLKKADVPVPEGRSFGAKADDREIIQYGESIGFPLVVKPVDSSKGRGVVSNIENTAELAEALQYIRQELQFSRLMIEQYIPGEEIRIYVVGNQVIGALNRIPANVIGDGRQFNHAINRSEK